MESKNDHRFGNYFQFFFDFFFKNYLTSSNEYRSNRSVNESALCTQIENTYRIIKVHLLKYFFFFWNSQNWSKGKQTVARQFSGIISIECSTVFYSMVIGLCNDHFNKILKRRNEHKQPLSNGKFSDKIVNKTHTLTQNNRRQYLLHAWNWPLYVSHIEMYIYVYIIFRSFSMIRSKPNQIKLDDLILTCLMLDPKQFFFYFEATDKFLALYNSLLFFFIRNFVCCFHTHCVWRQFRLRKVH